MKLRIVLNNSDVPNAYYILYSTKTKKMNVDVKWNGIPEVTNHINNCFKLVIVARVNANANYVYSL